MQPNKNPCLDNCMHCTLSQWNEQFNNFTIVFQTKPVYHIISMDLQCIISDIETVKIQSWILIYIDTLD